jgi:hypothetical protein
MYINYIRTRTFAEARNTIRGVQPLICLVDSVRLSRGFFSLFFPDQNFIQFLCALHTLPISYAVVLYQFMDRLLKDSTGTEYFTAL